VIWDQAQHLSADVLVVLLSKLAMSSDVLKGLTTVKMSEVLSSLVKFNFIDAKSLKAEVLNLFPVTSFSHLNNVAELSDAQREAYTNISFVVTDRPKLNIASFDKIFTSTMVQKIPRLIVAFVAGQNIDASTPKSILAACTLTDIATATSIADLGVLKPEYFVDTAFLTKHRDSSRQFLEAQVTALRGKPENCGIFTKSSFSPEACAALDSHCLVKLKEENMPPDCVVGLSIALLSTLYYHEMKSLGTGMESLTAAQIKGLPPRDKWLKDNHYNYTVWRNEKNTCKALKDTKLKDTEAMEALKTFCVENSASKFVSMLLLTLLAIVSVSFIIL